MGVRIVVVGTGTDVGKTHVTCALARSFREAGSRVVAWKPIASGVDGMTPGDAEAISESAGTPVIAPLYSFVPPISPHLAARQAGLTIDVEVLAKRADELSIGVDVLIVETAGGLFSPVAPGVFNADIVRRLMPCRVLLVAPDRIGVLHDVQATRLAARASDVEIDVVALSAALDPDASSGTNAGEIETVLGLRVAAVFPRAAATAESTRTAARAVVREAARVDMIGNRP